MRGLGFDIFARDKTGQAFAQVNNKVNGLNKKFDSLKGAVGGFTKLLAGGLAVKFFSDVAANASKIDDLSNRLGISAENLSRYQFIAERGGVELDGMAKAMQRLGANSIAAAQGNNAAAAALTTLGINAATFKNLGMDEQFALVAEKIQGVENPAERVRIAMDLMGKGGAEMLQVMDQGGASFLELRDRADELGVTLTDVQANALDTMNDAFDDVGYAVKGLAQDLLAFLAPAITKIVNAVAWAISQFQVFDHGMTKIGWGLVSLGNKVGIVSDEMYKLATIEAYERINGQVKQTNKSLGDQDELLERINGKMRQTPAESKKMADKVKQDNEDIKDSAKDLGDSWSESINGIKVDFNDLKGSALSAIQEIGESMLKNFLKGQFASSGGGTSFGLGDIGSALGGLGDFFGGFFAEGGNFMGGKPIVVGEEGPEIITPRAGGNVIPNHALGGGSNTINFNFPPGTDVASFRRSQSQLAAMASQGMQVGKKNM
jgi:hypothetical protein